MIAIHKSKFKVQMSKMCPTGALDAIKRNDIVVAASNVLSSLNGNKYEGIDQTEDELMSAYYDNAGLDYSYGYNDYGNGYKAGDGGVEPFPYSDYGDVITKSPAKRPPAAMQKRPFYADTPVEERPFYADTLAEERVKPQKKKTTSGGGKNTRRDSSESQV